MYFIKMFSNTLNCFSNFILLENVFGINRSHLLECPKKKLFGNTVSIISVTLLITVVIFDILTSNFDIGLRIFQAFLFIEFLVIIIAARSDDFAALKKLDEKCDVQDEYLNKLFTKCSLYTYLLFIGSVFDIIGMIIIKARATDVIIYSVLFCAHDCELILLSLIAESITLRLEKLKEASSVFGSRVYRHMLVATQFMNEEVAFRIMLVLTVVLVTTVTYFSAIMLLPMTMGVPTMAYILWRELKVFCCLWQVCRATSRGKAVCQHLQHHLARTLALEPATDKAKNPLNHGTLSRWYLAVLTERPCFLTGSVIAVGLSIPLHLLDLSVNYVLIIVQIYVAYN